MALVHSTCPEHGNFQTRSGRVTVMQFQYPDHTLYQLRFTCPRGNGGKGHRFVKDSDARQADLLLHAYAESEFYFMDLKEGEFRPFSEDLRTKPLDDSAVVDFQIDLHDDEGVKNSVKALEDYYRHGKERF